MINTVSSNMPYGPPHFVDLHVNSGESVSIQFMDGNEMILRGPNTIQMVSNNYYPPVPLPVQVPPGHMIEQIVDENGTLKHIVLSALGSSETSETSSSSSSNFMPPTLSFLPFVYSCCCYDSAYPSSSTSSSQSRPAVSNLSATSNPLGAPTPSANPTLPPPAIVFPTYARQRRSNRNFSLPGSKKINSSQALGNSSPTWSKLNASPRYKPEIKVTSTNNRNYDSINNRNINNQHFEPLPSMFEMRSDGTYYLTKLADPFNQKQTSPSTTTPAVHGNGEQSSQESVYKSFAMDNKKYDFVKKVCNVSHNINSFCHNCKQRAENSVETDVCSHQSSEMSEVNVGGSTKEEIQEKASFEETKKNNKKKEGKLELKNETWTATSSPTRSGKENGTIRQRQKSVVSSNDSKKSSRSASCSDDVSINNQHNKKLNLEESKNVVANGNIKCNANTGAIRDNNNKVILHNEIKNKVSDQSETTKECHTLKQAEGKAREEEDDEPIDDEEDDSEEEEDEEEEDEENRTKEEEHRAYKLSSLPKIEAITLSSTVVSFNYVRLRWQLKRTFEMPEKEKRNFIVDMLLTAGSADKDEKEPECRIVFQGTHMSCRVSHLRPQSTYSFRVRTITHDAVVVSNLLEVLTTHEQAASGPKTFGRKSKQQLQAQVLAQQQQIQHQQLLLRQQQHRKAGTDEKGRHGSYQNTMNHETLWSSIQKSEKQCAILIILAFTLAAVFGPAAFDLLFN